MSQVKISNLNPTNEVTSNDYFVIDNGSETRKIKAEKFIPPVYPFSFVGMVAQGTNLTTEASVKAIYGNDTSWSLLSSVALASENVFGNGYNLALTNGTNLVGLNTTGGLTKQGISFGVLSPALSGGSGSDITSSQGIGIPKKTQVSNNPEYTGIVVDTITVYMWERTA